MGLILRLAVCLTLHGIVTCQVDHVTEPVVYSRFDYDYKMLTKIIELELKQKELLKTVEELRSRQQGSSYIRWGKSSCPDNGTTFVYHGYVAGTSYGHSGNSAGAGANYLCLSAEPAWGHYKDGSQNSILLSGVTYEFNPYQKEIQKFFGKDILRQTATCSLCRSHRSTTVMIPGRNRCVIGWTEEYRGYLATGYPGYSDSSEFICIDERPDSVTNTASGSKDNLLYFVETKCGLGLPCPPYVDGRELPCVVCSL